MAFFEDLGKKLSQAGQSAVQKTKDFTDVAKLNSSISDEEKKINNFYSEIGKLYVSLHAEDCESAFAEAVKGIKEANQKIAEYRKQIQDIKGVVKCEKCGAEVETSSAFCKACGAPVAKETAPVAAPVKETAPAAEAEPAAAEEFVFCPECGQKVAKTMKFCTSCGKRMSE